MCENKTDICESTPPFNFSWVVEGKLAAMAWPQYVSNLNFLISVGVKHLITLSPEKKPPIHEVSGLEWTEIPIVEFKAPTLEQIQEFIQICENSQMKNEAVGIHCRQGKGRTGVMAACFLVYFENLPPSRAIINIRLQRPGSIETLEQEKIVEVFHDCLRTCR